MAFIFSAIDGDPEGNGRELWISDGTAAGTALLRDIDPAPFVASSRTSLGSGNSSPYGFIPLVDRGVVFTADDGVHGRELWFTDGSGRGTRLIADISPGLVPTGIVLLTPLGDGRIVFVASNLTGRGNPWITDGTAAGTFLLREIAPTPAQTAGIGPFLPLEPGRVLFGADDGVIGREFWITDGTTEGTRLLADINPGSRGSQVMSFGPLGDGRAVFGADDGSGSELWITDGTVAGTRLLRDINVVADPSRPAGATFGSAPMNFSALAPGKAVFSADEGLNGRELWVTDGTAPGTFLLKDICPSPVSNGPFGIVPLGNGRAIFLQDNRDVGRELWGTDGTREGTVLLADIEPGPGSSFPTSMTAVGGGKALFTAATTSPGRGLYVTDGTPDGTRLVTTKAGPNPVGFAAIGEGRVAFSGASTLGSEL